MPFSREVLTMEWPLSKLAKSRTAYKLYYYLLMTTPQGEPSLAIKKWNKAGTAQILKCDPRTVTSNLKS